MMTSSILTLAVLVLGADKPPPKPLVGISGVYCDDQLFVLHPGIRTTRVTVEVDPKITSWLETRVHYRSLYDGHARGDVYKILMAHDRFWCVGPGADRYSATPLEDLDLFELSEWASKRLEKKFPKTYAPKPYCYTSGDLFGLRGLDDIATITKELKDIGWDSRPTADILPNPLIKYFEAEIYFGIIKRRTPYDLVPTGANTATLIYSNKYFERVGGYDYDGSIAFQELDLGKPNRKSGDAFTKPVADSKLLCINVPIEGDFWAYHLDGVYYLQSRSGELYAVTKTKEGRLKSEKIWTDGKRPLVGAIQDVNKGKVYAFGWDSKDGKDGQRFALELSLKPTAIPYQTQAKPDDGFQEAKDALLAVYKSNVKK
jgi:hypothetical protein